MARLKGLFVVGCLFALGVALGSGLLVRQQAMVPLEIRVEARVPGAQAAELLALGHREALADLLWLSLLGFWLDNLEHARMQSSWLAPHLDAILALDPSFRIVYVWAGHLVHLSSDLGDASVIEANAYLRRGIAAFPNDWELHYLLGFNLLWEMNEGSAEERARHQAEGLQLLRRAAGLPGAPQHLHNLVVSLQMRQAEWSATAREAPPRFLSTTDPREARNLRGHMQAQLGLAPAASWARIRTSRRNVYRDPALVGTLPLVEGLLLEYPLRAPLVTLPVSRLEEQQ